MSSSLLNPSLPIRIPTKPYNFHFKKLGLGFFSPTPTRSNRIRANSIMCEKKDDGYYMRRCVELARTAIGRTSPNPMVGCVIVDDGGEIVGEGFHPKAGQPHAEVFALRNAGSLAENATAYVSLEPCNHYGRTPPCTESLIGAKVKRVVIGMVDPNPIVASKGVEKLKASGIDVTVGVEEMLCQKLNEAYVHRMLTGKPFVTLRYSLSFEGKILNNLGRGSEESGGYYSRMLREYDGIVSYSNIFSRSSNLPSSQEAGANQPIQIITASAESSSLSLPTSIAKSSARVIVLAGKPVTVEPESERLEVVVLEQMNLSSILAYCGSQGLCSIILDLRGDYGGFIDLVKDGLDENLVQKVVVELCPNQDATEPPILTFGGKSLRLKNLKSKVVNESIVVEGYISQSCRIVR